MARNLLFITTDQQRWDSLPCYGRSFMQTPNLDRLANEGLVFDTCIVPSPVCVPCRAAMMSGQYPAVTGVLGNGNWLPKHVPTWPSIVKTSARVPSVTRTSSVLVSGTTSGLELRVCGQTRLTTKARVSGTTIGPPEESE